ncbi:MAG: flagellar hook assembly protein FlgD [Anaeromyxobacter sp.]|nr:flagellar hook assembly protein FlgD [Anaeromyxobacter sp.]MBL0276199.1 flagellar hook assembly protein FlgD [Anaeromyxobacter sp.]
MADVVTSSLGSLPQVTGVVAPTAKSTLDKDSFLKLLTTQLQKQDPLSPMDSNAFVAQLAQFSSVEALENMGRKLDTLALGQANANQMAVPQMIGKEILFNADHLALTKGAAATKFSVLLGAASDNTVAMITDAAGKVVRTLDLGARGAGTFATEWDGRDDQGQPLDSGTYQLIVAASKRDGTEVGSATFVRGVVSGVSFEGSVPQLLVNGNVVQLGDVTEIATAPPT